MMGNEASVSMQTSTCDHTNGNAYTHLQKDMNTCESMRLSDEPMLDQECDENHTNTSIVYPPPTQTTQALVPLASPDYIRPVMYAIPMGLWFAGEFVCHSIKQLKSLFVAPEYDKHKVTDAIEKLQSTLQFLDRKMCAMNANVEKYTQEAKRLYACKNKPGAIHQLRLKKMYEREVSKMDSLKFNIESNILHMESVDVMMETVSTIKETSHQFQIVSKHVDIGKLEDSIEEMFEQRDTSKDIETILHDMHDSHEFDEDELMQELETLVASDPSSPSSHEVLIQTMPRAPSTAIITNIENKPKDSIDVDHEEQPRHEQKATVVGVVS